MKKIKNAKGITLIALVITIIILLILAGIILNVLWGEGGIINQAEKAKIINELATYKEQLDMFVKEKTIEDQTYEEESLTAGKTELQYNTKKEEGGNIKTVIPGISNEYLEKLEIIKGELLINTKDKREIEIAQSMGIEVNPYDITEEGELLSSNGNLLLMDRNGTITIPERVTKIGEGAFANVEGLKTIIIPGTVKEISKNAFAYNTTLETVIMKDGVQKIGGGAFRNCTQLKTVEMPDSVYEIGTELFSNDENLTYIKLSSGISIIEDSMFSYCRSLKKVQIPEEVTEIGLAAFTYCTELSKINLPKNLSLIDPSALSWCPNLTEFDIDAENENFHLENGFLLNKDRTEMIYIQKSAINNGTLIIPGTVTSVSYSLIGIYNDILKVVKIPEFMEKISDAFFSANTKLEKIEVDSNNLYFSSTEEALYNKNKTKLIYYYKQSETLTLPNTLEEIGIYSLKSNYMLKELTLPDSVTRIEYRSLPTGLKTLNIGGKVNYISPVFTESKTNLDIQVNIDDLNPYYCVENNMLFNKEKTKLIATVSNDESYIIPNSVTEIGEQAFFWCTNLKTVTIPNTVTRIGSEAFYQCTSLRSIEIPSSVKEISTNCFNNSHNLSEIIIYNEPGTIIGSPWGCIFGDKAIIWKGKN